MINEHTDKDTIKIENRNIKNVNNCVYFGQEIMLGEANRELEIYRKIRLGWVAYGKMQNIFKSKLFCA